MRKYLLALAILAAVPLAGCGDETGYYQGDQGLNTPAREVPPASGVGEAPNGSGLLHPRKHKRDKPEKRTRRPKKAQSGLEPEQQVAGAQRESAVREVSTPVGALEEPEPDAPVAKQPPLTATQSAGLESVRAALRELFTRLNARDSSLCTDLLTQRHVEEASGLSGPEAVARCRDDVAGSTASYSLNKISGVRIEGDLALIRFASSIGDYARWQVLRAARGGAAGWRFDGDGSADS